MTILVTFDSKTEKYTAKQRGADNEWIIGEGNSLNSALDDVERKNSGYSNLSGTRIRDK